MQAYSSVWAYLRDVAIGFALIIGGFLLLDELAPLAAPVLPEATAYVSALAICLFPFFWFARRALQPPIGWLDYVVIVGLQVSLVAVIELVFGRIEGFAAFLHYVLLIVLFPASMTLCLLLRMWRRWPEAPQDNDPP